MKRFQAKIREPLTLLALVGLLGACGDSEATGIDGIPYEDLALYGFFEGAISELNPADNVFPYTVATPLWSDNSKKDRFIFLPPGTHIEPTAEEGWALPVGAVVIKNFGYLNDFRDASLGGWTIETRLLIREEQGFTAHVYLWNEAQTEARRFVGGTRNMVSYVDQDGESQAHEYVVPNTNQCGSCHARDDELELLGVIGPQMSTTVERDDNQVDQLSWLADQGAFGSAPPPSGVVALPAPFGTADLAERARGWLHANCSHCHRPGGAGGVSGLVLLAWETDTNSLGFCKSPAAAGSGTGGFDYDIVPGMPEESIMPFRIRSMEPEIRMPELPNRVTHEQGAQLVEDWIASLTPTGCPP